MSGRGAMTPSRKARIWNARNGLCGECAQPVDMIGPTVIYDHRIPLWISRSDADDGIWPVHNTQECNGVKTYQSDLPTIAKIKRIIKKSDPLTRPKPKMKSTGRKIEGRGFSPKPDGYRHQWSRRPFA